MGKFDLEARYNDGDPALTYNKVNKNFFSMYNYLICNIHIYNNGRYLTCAVTMKIRSAKKKFNN